MPSMPGVKLRSFSEEERAILALTEEVTLISDHVKDETYAQAAKVLEEIYLAQVILAIITINVWNRIGIATNLMPVQSWYRKLIIK